jgi:hypothetical protein
LSRAERVGSSVMISVRSNVGMSVMVFLCGLGKHHTRHAYDDGGHHPV